MVFSFFYRNNTCYYGFCCDNEKPCVSFSNNARADSSPLYTRNLLIITPPPQNLDNSLSKSIPSLEDDGQTLFAVNRDLTENPYHKRSLPTLCISSNNADKFSFSTPIFISTFLQDRRSISSYAGQDSAVCSYPHFNLIHHFALTRIKSALS